MTDIPTRTLGRTGLEVTVLGFGAMELRDTPKGRPVDEEQAGRLLNAVLDAGINLVDTSIDYGLSEERIGRHISHRRDEFHLASKCGCPVDADPRTVGGGTPHDYSRDNIRAGVEQSLRRLRTDHLDLLQVHMSPSAEVLDEHDVVATMTELRDEGKIRHLGMSATLPHLVDHLALGVFDVFQVPYSALEPETGPWISRAAQAGAGVIVRGGVAKGAPDAAGTAPRADQLAPVWERADLGAVLGELSPMELILRYTVSHQDVGTTIVGTLSVDHLRDNVHAAARGPLPRDVHDEVTRRVEAALVT